MNVSVTETAFMLLSQSCRTTQQNIIAAFDNLDSYAVREKKKRTGGYRVTYAPHSSLKFVQRLLLDHFFRQLDRRTRFYFGSSGGRVESSKVFFRPVLSHLLHPSIHGGRQKRSVATTAHAHTDGDRYFVINIDLKDAFPSVKNDALKNMLYKVICDDCQAIFETNKYRYQVKNLKSVMKALFESVGVLPNVPQDWHWSAHFEKYEVLIKEWEQKARVYMHSVGYQNFYQREYLLHQAAVEFKDGHGDEFIKKITKDSFPRYSLFPQSRFKEFRQYIRDESKKNTQFTETQLPEIIDQFTEYLVSLCTYKGFLPQGAPTSNFLFTLMLSESGFLSMMDHEKTVSVSVYVDDIYISTNTDPYPDFLERIKDVIAGAGFEHNPKKVRVYDLRHGAAPMLGMKLVRRPATKREIQKIGKEHNNYQPKGFSRAMKTQRPWFVSSVTLPKKKQKTYRAALHRVMIEDGKNGDSFNKAMGYHGHIVSTYGSAIETLPSSLKQVVKKFREKFISEKEYKKTAQ